VTACLSAIPLGWQVVVGDMGPAWFGWMGMVWGAIFAIGFVLTRGGAFFAPPFWAHLFTGALGLNLRLSSDRGCRCWSSWSLIWEKRTQ